MKIAAIVAAAAAVVLLALLAILVWHGEVQAPATTTATAPVKAPAPTAKAKDDAPFTVIEQKEVLTAKTLPGTTWRFGPYTFDFHDQGTVTINAGVPGQWRLVGKNVVIEAQTQTMTGQLDGTQLLFDGKPAKRIRLKERPRPEAQMHMGVPPR